MANPAKLAVRLGPLAPTASPNVVHRSCAFEAEESVARFAEDGWTALWVPPIIGEVNRSGGKPLDIGLRARLEPAFGWNFANVRIHADDRAAQAARAVNARAYTSGNHLVFADGQFLPESTSGNQLLIHELAHVVQQSTGSVRAGISRPGDPSEREAERLANSIADEGSFERERAELGPSDSEIAPADAWGPGVHSVVGAADQVVQRWPGDGMLAPGDCTWATYFLLRGAVEAAKAVVNTLGACTAADSCPVLAGKIAAITTEITVRVALDTTCFKGGDTGHRQQVQDKIGMLNRCYRYFTDMNCEAQLAAAAAAAAAAAEQAAAAEAATLAEVDESAAAAGELIEGAAAAGEAVEGGVTLIEVLELLPLLAL